MTTNEKQIINELARLTTLKGLYVAIYQLGYKKGFEASESDRNHAEIINVAVESAKKLMKVKK